MSPYFHVRTTACGKGCERRKKRDTRTSATAPVTRESDIDISCFSFFTIVPIQKNRLDQTSSAIGKVGSITLSLLKKLSDPGVCSSAKIEPAGRDLGRTTGPMCTSVERGGEGTDFTDATAADGLWWLRPRDVRSDSADRRPPEMRRSCQPKAFGCDRGPDNLCLATDAFLHGQKIDTRCFGMPPISKCTDYIVKLRATTGRFPARGSRTSGRDSCSDGVRIRSELLQCGRQPCTEPRR